MTGQAKATAGFVIHVIQKLALLMTNIVGVVCIPISNPFYGVGVSDSIGISVGVSVGICVSVGVAVGVLEGIFVGIVVAVGTSCVVMMS